MSDVTPRLEKRLHRELYERQQAFHERAGASRKGLGLVAAAEALRAFDLLSSSLYRVRARFKPTHPLRAAAEDFVLEASQDLLNLQKSHIDDKARHQGFYLLYRLAFRRHVHLFFFVSLFFFSVLAASALFFDRNPAYAQSVVPQRLVEQVLDNQKWFERLQDAPLLGALGISWNNTKVGITAFLGGAALGIGTLFVMLSNAIQIGAIKGLSSARGFDALFNFIGGHGPLELTLICACGFAGFVYGKSFYTWGSGLPFAARFRAAAKDATIIIIGVVPWFFVAGTIEAFLSPFHYFTGIEKLLIGFAFLMLFLAWTFWPLPDEIAAP